MTNITVDTTGLSNELIDKLTNETLAKFQEARDALPVSWLDRVEKIAQHLPIDTDIDTIHAEIAPMLEAELSSHFENRKLIEHLTELAENCMNFTGEYFDDSRFQSESEQMLKAIFE